MENKKEPDMSVQQQLAALIPEAGNLEKTEQVMLHGLVRRAILFEKKQGEEAVSIFKPGETKQLEQFQAGLQNTPEDEIKSKVTEFGMDDEEAEIESANWSFRHQSARGEMLVKNTLIPFQMVRIEQYQYLLLVSGGVSAVMEAFIPVFTKIPDIYSEDAFQTDGHRWSGWIWVTDPDDVQVAIQKDKIKSMWKGCKHEISNNPRE
ncbi:hypothetical protein K8S19_11235 [bacterium]|nr:hypothetical protein [bacterium]